MTKKYQSISNNNFNKQKSGCFHKENSRLQTLYQISILFCFTSLFRHLMTHCQVSYRSSYEQ